jgi:FkbM family methyltransferase
MNSRTIFRLPPRVMTWNITTQNDSVLDKYLKLIGIEWESWMRQDLPFLIKENCDIIDIGGNIGCNALMFSDYCPVHTYEPITYDMLNTNVKNNMNVNPISIYPYALSNESTEKTIYTGEDNAGNTFTPDVKTYIGSKTIKCEKLDDVYTGRPPCLIKIDVEGHEMEVLEGAKKILQAHLPALYVENVNDKITNLLREIGYKLCIERPDHNWIILKEDIPDIFNPYNTNTIIPVTTMATKNLHQK